MLSIFIPQASHLIYNQVAHPNIESLIPICFFVILLPSCAWRVWHAPGVAQKQEEEVTAIRCAQADPRFTHIEHS